MCSETPGLHTALGKTGCACGGGTAASFPSSVLPEALRPSVRGQRRHPSGLGTRIRARARSSIRTKR
eukprot:5095561-Alexandrium_andersonii.AAC.1